MKKIIPICLLSILMLSFTAEAEKCKTFNMNPGPLPSYSVWVKIILSFHRPKTQCKSGFGICLDFEFGADKAAGFGETGCPAAARINESGKLELRMTETDLQKYENGTSLQYFRKGTITIEDAYTFSEPVTKALGVSGQITIRPGAYPVVYDASAQTYTVSFQF
jgi:hypothetical protein